MSAFLFVISSSFLMNMNYINWETLDVGVLEIFIVAWDSLSGGLPGGNSENEN